MVLTRKFRPFKNIPCTQTVKDENEYPDWMGIPEIVKYIDLNVYGWIPVSETDLDDSHTWNLWYYVLGELQIKNRPEFWHILQLLARELKTV